MTLIIKNEDVFDKHVLDLIENILKKESLENCTINTKEGSAKGQNFIGVIVKAQISGTNEKNEVVNKHLVVKIAPSSEDVRNSYPVDKGYLREIFMYSEVLPLFEKFQKTKSLHTPFNSYAKYFASTINNRQETVVMEDINASGFSMQSKLISVDYPHCSLIVKELGRYHALSFALKDQQPNVYNDLRSRLKPDNFFSEQYMKTVFSSRFKTVSHYFNPEVEKDVLKKYNEVAEDMVFYTAQALDPEDADGYDVILHGDSWVNNFLFKYENPEKDHPTRVCFIDWQLSRIGSPLIDFYHFLYPCTEKELRDNHFDDLLQDYYGSLTDFLKELGSDPEKLFPERVFREHVKKHSLWGLGAAHFLVPMILMEAADFPKTATGEEDKVVEDVTMNERSLSKLKDVFYDIYERKFI